MPGINDAPADGAGSGEIIVQHLTIPGADRPLQRKELFGEAAQDLEGCVLIGQKYVAPHGRITGRDAGKVAKPGGGEVDHLRIGHPVQIIGHAHHRIGDQMRRMAGHRQHQVVHMIILEFHVLC